MPESLRASIRPKAAVASGVIAASLPPVTTTSASPCRISRSAMPIACAPAAQADTVPNDCPRRSCFIAITPDAAFAISSGIDSGEIRSAPSSRRMMCWCSSVPMPPMPVPITLAARSGSTGGPPFQPASSIASPAGRECELRVAVRAAHLLHGEVLLRLELARAAVALLDTGHAGRPALVERPRAHAQRRDRAHSGDDDRARHPSFDITRSTA
jgi:hypothetical protein